jgi:hypothetical protein
MLCGNRQRLVHLDQQRNIIEKGTDRTLAVQLARVALEVDVHEAIAADHPNRTTVLHYRQGQQF